MSMYTESRAQFSRLAQQRGVEVTQIPVTLGQDGSALHLTYTVLGDLQANTCIVVFSGVHGVEGTTWCTYTGNPSQGFPNAKTYCDLPGACRQSLGYA
ncbi:DUF2817 domain-containing protein [Enterobacter cloacae]|uniref:DUF2817 domain-containing protein n=1 Tax=Enterobacter cloacae TaxID=550 RepID=UPI001376A330|nr:DUF2817 domain-containing protein [Enterobacter cloacae]NBC60629.1 DUF2817 domain-containing protein [Enterobacter cloacae]